VDPGRDTRAQSFARRRCAVGRAADTRAPTPAQATSRAMAAWHAVLIVVALLALLVASGRAREVCVLSVRRGRVLVMRGGLPQSLESALVDVFTRAHVARATVRIVRDGTRARLTASGLPELALQRARNVLGTYSMPRLLAGHARRRRNIGQRLGLASLAWWLHGRP